MSEVAPSADARPKAVSDDEIAWARHLLRDERNLVMLAGSMRPLYSAFDDGADPPRFVWRSFTTTRRSRFIDGWRSNEETQGLAPVEILLLDSKSPNVSVTFNALARRVPLEHVPGALAMYTAARKRRGEDTDPNRPETFYEALVTRATIPVPLLEPDGRHTGEDHAELPLDRLRNLAGE
jgi:hypothetical protein